MTHMDPLALYGAITATVALSWGIGWSLYTWRRQFRTRVDIEIRAVPVEDVDETKLNWVVFRVTNHSHHPVRPLAVILLDESKDRELVYTRGQPFGPIPPRDSMEEWIKGTQELIDEGVIVGRVALSTKQVFDSDPLDLRELALSGVYEWRPPP